LLASRLLAELAGEDDVDRAISRTSDKIATLAREALDEDTVVWFWIGSHADDDKLLARR
jgi:hypothetical protein